MWNPHNLETSHMVWVLYCTRHCSTALTRPPHTWIKHVWCDYCSYCFGRMLPIQLSGCWQYTRALVLDVIYTKRYRNHKMTQGLTKKIEVSNPPSWHASPRVWDDSVRKTEYCSGKPPWDVTCLGTQSTITAHMGNDTGFYYFLLDQWPLWKWPLE